MPPGGPSEDSLNELASTGHWVAMSFCYRKMRRSGVGWLALVALGAASVPVFAQANLLQRGGSPEGRESDGEEQESEPAKPSSKQESLMLTIDSRAALEPAALIRHLEELLDVPVAWQPLLPERNSATPADHYAIEVRSGGGSRVEILYRSGQASGVVRFVELEGSKEERVRTVAFVVANMVSDQAGPLLARLKASSPAREGSSAVESGNAARPDGRAASESRGSKPKNRPTPAESVHDSHNSAGQSHPKLFANLSLYDSISVVKDAHQKDFNLELGFAYSRVHGIEGLGLTLGYLQVEAETKGALVSAGVVDSGVETSGVVVTGLVSYGRGELRGAEIASLVNFRRGEVVGVQTAGLLNRAERLTGGQMGGVNLVEEGAEGAVVASLFNYTGGNLEGVAASGLLNLTKGKSTGVMVSGAVNLQRQEVVGAQVASLVNLAGDHQGVQAAGLNRALHLRGVQIGLVNLAQRTDGAQIGLVNISDEMKGAPLGIVNVIGNARPQVLATTSMRHSDAGYQGVGELAYKVLLDPMYSIAGVGTVTPGAKTLGGSLDEASNTKTLVYSVGLGAQQALSKNVYVAADASYTGDKLLDSAESPQQALLYRAMLGAELGMVGAFLGGGVRQSFGGDSVRHDPLVLLGFSASLTSNAETTRAEGARTHEHGGL